jgi:predicted MFS family arabinose efflux permease
VVPLDLLTHPVVAVSSAALFLATGALFAVNVFVPLFLQATTGATPTQAGLLLMPMMLGIAASTAYAGRAIERTGRYKRYPVAGLALMTVALTGLAVAAGHPSRVTIGAGLVVFGAGFGMVGQVLVTAVQNAVDRRRLGVAMATTGFFRAAGGATGAAVFGTVFAASADPLAGVQAVFAVAAPVAALGLLVTLLLREVPLQRATPADPVRTTPSAAGAASPAPTAPRRGAR